MYLQDFLDQPTSFIGRVAEIAKIAALIDSATCRLLTIVGPGGIGKTRLAIQSMDQVTNTFEQGIYLVGLQSATSDAYLLAAIADAIHFPLSGNENPLLQLQSFLSNKNMLLLLDNFEQLIKQDGPEILSAILAAAPNVKMLVTSREVLNLQEEWLYPLHGLPISISIPEDSGAFGDALHLFQVRAKQIQPTFSLTTHVETVTRICQLVDGIPLAIELAASWIKTLSCQAIADEIGQNIDFLSTSLRNVPERHQSMMAVFDYSWQLLTEAEKDVFQRLSVFRGGFQREAAKQVASATLRILAALVDKSLLQLGADNRYQIHELLRQYGEDKLQVHSDVYLATYQDHCAYYANFLDQRRITIESGDQPETTLAIEAELENIRAARLWAVDHHCLAEISKGAHTFALFCHFQSRYLEAANAFEQDLESLKILEPTRDVSLTIADVMVRLGWFYIRLGRYGDADEVLKRSQQLHTTLKTVPYKACGADYLSALSILSVISGDSTEALRLGHEARQIHEARNDQQNLAFAFHALTSATLAQGDYENALQYAKQACEAAQTAGNRWYLAYCLNGWGDVACAMGNYAEAEQHFWESYYIREVFDDPEGMAVALNHLGDVAIAQADYAKAKQRYQQSHAIYQKINDSGGLAIALHGLGQSAFSLNAYPTAASYYQQALDIASKTQFLPLIGQLFISIGELFLKAGMVKRGLVLLTFIRRYSSSEQRVKDRAEQMLNYYSAKAPAKDILITIKHNSLPQIEALISTMKHDLASIINQHQALDETDQRNSHVDLILLDPLTKRELDVLQLIATGHSNREIGEALVLAVGSVKWYASQIFSKLQVKNRTEAAAKARDLGLLR